MLALRLLPVLAVASLVDSNQRVPRDASIYPLLRHIDFQNPEGPHFTFPDMKRFVNFGRQFYTPRPRLGPGYTPQPRLGPGFTPRPRLGYHHPSTALTPSYSDTMPFSFRDISVAEIPRDTETKPTASDVKAMSYYRLPSPSRKEPVSETPQARTVFKSKPETQAKPQLPSRDVQAMSLFKALLERVEGVEQQPRKASLQKASLRKASLWKASPGKASPRKASPRKASLRKAAGHLSLPSMVESVFDNSIDDFRVRLHPEEELANRPY